MIRISYPAEELLKDMFLVLDENTKEIAETPDDITPESAQVMKKDLLEARQSGKLKLSGIDANWVWRLCAARLMRGSFDKPWCWKGFEYRSEWALNHYKWGHQWFKQWEGGNCKMRVLAEQGIGEEILFASVFDELLDECPDAVIEIDNRLLPVMRRSFNGNFVSRWILKERTPPSPEHYDDLNIMEDYDSYVPAGNLLPRYRTGKFPPGTPYLKADEDRVADFRKRLEALGPPPYIGISWKGGRSRMTPDQLRAKKGTYISLQYKKGENGMETDPGPVHSFNTSHDDMEEVFALCKALDEVVTTQNYIVHVCGSQGVKCSVVRPPPIHGPVGTPESDNNRLKWAYGIGEDLWQMPWYNSVTVYRNDTVYRACHSDCLDLPDHAEIPVSSGPRGNDPDQDHLGFAVCK